MIKILPPCFNLKTLFKVTVIPLMMALSLNSCKNDSVALATLTPPARATFSTTAITLEKDQSAATQVVVNLSRAMASAGTLTISITDASTALSTQYITTPATVSNLITLNLDKGATTASFTILSAHNFDDIKTAVFKINSATGGAVTGETNQSITATLRGNNWVNPSITASATTLAGFGSVNNGALSAAKTFTITGQNLGNGVAITASDNFKVSLDNVTFASSLSSAISGTATIYVKFAPASGKNQDLTGTITASSSGVGSVTIAVSGTEAGNVVFVPEVPILNENFDYGATTNFLTRASADWTAYSAAGAIPVVYIPTGLTFPRYAGSGIGGSVTIEHGDFSREDVVRTFSPKTTGVLYVSTMMNITAAGTGDFFMALRDASGAFFNRLYAKDDGTGKLVFGAGKNSTAVYATGTYKYNTTYVVVVKYDFTAKTSTLYVLDGALSDTEPGTPAAVSSTGTAPTTLNDIVIRQSDGILSGNLDGIRIATTWRGALGI